MFTNFILFGKRSKGFSWQNFKIPIDNTIIERVTHTKFLGVFIDKDLSWKYHTSHIFVKVSRSLGILNCVKYILTPELLTTLYYTMINHYLSSCNIIWGGVSAIALKKLTCLQKRAIRLITCSHYRESSTPLFARLCIIKLGDNYKTQVLLFMYKAKNSMLT